MSSKSVRLTVRPLCEDDLTHFDPIDLQASDLVDMREALLIAGEMLPHQGCAVDRNGKPVLLFGFVECWPRVFDVWTLFGKGWKPIMYPDAKKWFDDYCALLEFDRIQHTISEERPWMHKVIKYLGFQCETPVPLRKYQNGKDYYIYSRIKEQ